MNMLVSGISVIDGEKKAYILFEDENRSAEGIIPDCKIVKNNGFDDDEIGQLEIYLKCNLGELKKQAASVNPIKAMMED